MSTFTPEQARNMILAGTAPANMTVKGDLILWRCTTLTKLPKGLRVEGWLDLLGCTALTHLPKGLEVGGDLILRDCTALTELPDDFKVEGLLDLRGCTTLTHLPDGWKVKNWLILAGCTALKSLPDDLNVGSWLNLTGCTALTQLPYGLSVKGNLNLEGCTALIKLPDGLRVEGSLMLENCTALTKLPEGLKVGDYIILNQSLHIPDTVQCPNFVFRNTEHFPREFINNPQLIKSADILNEQNAQKRSVLLELMGVQRFMREANSTIIHQDVEVSGNVRQLLRVELPVLRAGWDNSPVQEEPIVMLSVTCPSTAHHYMLRVPPDMQTCHQAAAWIAGFDDPEQYQPLLET
jgi:hypothetical protein